LGSAIAYEAGARWCVGHDLPGDPQVTAPAVTSPPSTTVPPPPTITPAAITTLAQACAKVHELASPGSAGRGVPTETMVQLRGVFANVPDPILQGLLPATGPTTEVGTQLAHMLVWCLTHNDGQ
jgi:hypothetical protein